MKQLTLQIGVPPLAAARATHMLAALPSGKVFASGGDIGATGVTTSEVYDPTPSAPGWSSAAAPPIGGDPGSFCALPDGRVLLINAFDAATFKLVTGTYLYDPAANAWTRYADMPLFQGHPVGTTMLAPLPGGRVFVSGGFIDTPSNTWTNLAYVFDPAANTWTQQGDVLPFFLDGGVATRLSSGRVLVTGGINNHIYSTATALYDLAAQRWSLGPTALYARAFHFAQELPDGRVLLVGGAKPGQNFDTAEILDLRQGFSTAIPSTIQGRRGSYPPNVARLPSGRFLVAGGQDAGTFNSLVNTDILDPVAGAWLPAAPLHVARSYAGLAALPSGRVLAVGGYTGAFGPPTRVCEVYDEATNTWAVTNPDGTSLGVPESVEGVAGVNVQVDGAFSATVQIDGSVPGDVYLPVATGQTSAVTLAPSPSAVRYLRARYSAYTSGAARVTVGAT